MALPAQADLQTADSDVDMKRMRESEDDSEVGRKRPFETLASSCACFNGKAPCN